MPHKTLYKRSTMIDKFFTLLPEGMNGGQSIPNQTRICCTMIASFDLTSIVKDKKKKQVSDPGITLVVLPVNTITWHNLVKLIDHHCQLVKASRNKTISHNYNECIDQSIGANNVQAGRWV